MAGGRVDAVHLDVLSQADPEDPGRWTKFCRKIGKTVYAVYDHKKGAAAAWAVGIAASIGLGIATGGASLLIQFAAGTAYGLAKGAGGGLWDYKKYKSNKKRLEKLKNSDPSRIGREDLRAGMENLKYNEEHLKGSLYKATHAFLKLKRWEGAASCMRAASDPLTPLAREAKLTTAEATRMLTDMYNFYFEYDRALHYFTQYEQFVEYAHAYAGAQADWYNLEVDGWDKAIEATVNAKSAWHVVTCRKSTLHKDVCYGASKVRPTLNDGEHLGHPHHRVTE